MANATPRRHHRAWGWSRPWATRSTGSGRRSARAGAGSAPLTLFDTTEFKVHFGGQVHDWDPVARFGVKEARHLDRFAQFAMAASIVGGRGLGDRLRDAARRTPAA